MKRHYDGLDAVTVPIDGAAILTSSTSSCIAMIQLQLVNGVCATDPAFQQIEWVGNMS